MKTSNYWSRLNVLKKDKNKQKSLFISLKEPNFFHRKDYEIKKSSTHDFTENEIAEISEFYTKNFRINGSNITNVLTISDINRYLNLDVELITIYKENKIIGSIISFSIPLTISISEIEIPEINVSQRAKNFAKEGSIYFACTSFLILDDKHRGKGYGMSLIQESLEVMYSNGGLSAYFVNNVPRGKNSIKLYVWFYPFNFSKIRKCGFQYPIGYEHAFQARYDDRIEKITDDIKGYEFYCSYMKDKIFYFSPSISYWNKWIKVFDTYLVYKDNEVIGLFSFLHEKLYHPSCKDYINKGNLLLCIGKQPETINASITVARNTFDIMTIRESGDVTFELLKSIFAQGLTTANINFYNTNLEITSRDFYAPIF